MHIDGGVVTRGPILPNRQGGISPRERRTATCLWGPLMPDGRFVSRSIAQCEQLGTVSLAADYLFARCIPHLDREGRMAGHPDLVKSIACPLRPEINSGSIPDLLRELAGVGLLVWYQVQDRQVLFFPGFAAHQRGLKHDREAPSRYPAHTSKETQDLGKSKSGPTPDQVRLSEVKGSEGKGSLSLSEVQLSAPPTPAKKNGHPETWVQQAVAIWAEHQGTIGYGKAGKLLKPLVSQHGESEVLHRFKVFAAGEQARFGVPYFSEHYAAFAKEDDWVVTKDGYRIPLVPDPVEYRPDA